MTERTGPKISSWPIRSIGLMPEKIVGWKKCPSARWWSSARPPPTTSSPSVRPIWTYDDTLSSASALMSGPTSTSGSSPEPSRSSRVRASSRWRSGSRTACSTITREQAVQRWPVVPKADQRIPSAARSRSASARTTTPFLPPSSSDRRLSRRPARSAIPVPVAELPVNDTTATSGLSTIALPTSAPVPVTRLTTPGGKPASASSSTRSTAQCGVSDDGLNTTVLPVTSAGIIFQQGIAIGKFQGVMMPATPSGWRMLIAHLSGSSDGTVSPAIRRPSPAIRNAMSIPSWTSPRASASTLPISRVIARASRSLCWAISAPNAYSSSPRFGAGVRSHIGWAVSAARMAIATSAAVPCWNRPIRSWRSAGLRLSNVVREVDSHHSPAMKWPNVGTAASVPAGCVSISVMARV